MTVKFIKLKKISNQKGDLIKFVEINKKFFLKKISEIYLSELNPLSKKAWKINYTCGQFFTNLNGKLTFIYKKKFTDKYKSKIIKTYNAVYIPKNTYYGFKNTSKKQKCLILNTLEIKHKNCKFANMKYEK
tara:strand:+ start:49 stop:441 length:393 start_codon:yes stop_codon:yes gene_type:complete